MFPSIFLLLSACLWKWTDAATTAAAPVSKPKDEVGWDNANWPTVIPLVHFGEKSYYFAVNFQATYFEADQFCKDIDMDLVRVESREENDFLYNYAQQSTKVDNFWTSGSKLLDMKNWIWMTTGEIVEYVNWGSGQPDNPNSEFCLELWLFRNKGLIFNDRPCNTKFAFICEKDKRLHIGNHGENSNWNSIFQSPSVSPNINLLHFESKSYYFSTFAARYLQANQFCQMIDMGLVSIFKETENSRLHKYIRDTNMGDHFWSSGTKLIDGKNWVWLSVGIKVNYTNWLPGQPDFDSEQCIELVQNRNDGLFWNNLDCNNELKFICERFDSRPVWGPGWVIGHGPGQVVSPNPSPIPAGSCEGQSQPIINIYVNNNQCSSSKNASTKNGEGCAVVNNNIESCPGCRKTTSHSPPVY